MKQDENFSAPSRLAFTDLPYEILAMIFKKVNFVDFRVRRVSKFFQNIFVKPHTSNEMAILHKKPEYVSHIISRSELILAEKEENIKQGKLSYKIFSNLKSFNQSDNTIRINLTDIPNTIEHLTLNGARVKTKYKAKSTNGVLLFPKLKTLKLVDINNFNNSSYVYNYVNFPIKQFLHVENLEIESLALLAHSNIVFPNLNKLTILFDEVTITNPSLIKLSKMFPRLKSLKIVFTEQTEQEIDVNEFPLEFGELTLQSFVLQGDCNIKLDISMLKTVDRVKILLQNAPLDLSKIMWPKNIKNLHIPYPLQYENPKFENLNMESIRTLSVDFSRLRYYPGTTNIIQNSDKFPIDALAKCFSTLKQLNILLHENCINVRTNLASDKVTYIYSRMVGKNFDPNFINIFKELVGYPTIVKLEFEEFIKSLTIPHTIFKDGKQQIRIIPESIDAMNYVTYDDKDNIITHIDMEEFKNINVEVVNCSTCDNLQSIRNLPYKLSKLLLSPKALIQINPFIIALSNLHTNFDIYYFISPRGNTYMPTINTNNNLTFDDNTPISLNLIRGEIKKQNFARLAPDLNTITFNDCHNFDNVDFSQIPDSVSRLIITNSHVNGANFENTNIQTIKIINTTFTNFVLPRNLKFLELSHDIDLIKLAAQNPHINWLNDKVSKYRPHAERLNNEHVSNYQRM